MGKIFCGMGKSASGKDTIYRRLMEAPGLGLERIVLYTTRPIREGEAEGRLKERLEIARKLKENGFSIADIVRVAGLSAEEIDKL